MPLIKIQPSSLNVSATYTVAGLIANGVNIGPTLTAAFNKANSALANTTGTFEGTLTIKNNLIVSGNTSKVGIGTSVPLANLHVTGSVLTGKLTYSPVLVSKTLNATDAADSDNFGCAVATNSDGSIMAVGAKNWEGATGSNRGGVYIYQWNGLEWIQRGSVLEAPDAADSDNFGSSVALDVSGNMLAVGAPNWEGASGSNIGGVYIFIWDGSNWSQSGSVLEASDAASDDNFGSSVSIAGDFTTGAYLISGAPNREGATGTNRGAVYTFFYDGVSWSELSILTASDEADGDGFGSSVSIAQTEAAILAVGSPNWEGASGTNRGGVYFYTLGVGDIWSQSGSVLEASDAADNDAFGSSVAVSADATTVAVGARSWEFNVFTTNVGGVYIFRRNPGSITWTQQGEVLSNKDDRSYSPASDNFGSGISLDYYGTRLIVATEAWEGATGSNRGIVSTYSMSGANPTSVVSTGAGFIDNGDLTARTDGFDRLTIKKSGNVGIGIANATSNLHVVGTANITSNLIVQGADILATISVAFDKANQVGEAVTTANSNITSAFNKANNALPLTGGTITGDISIVGNISVTGNTSYIAVQNYQVDDPLIYLAGNNYVSDIVDIGFIANYNNATGSNVHTGLFRDHTTKEYYLFQGYDKEPINNHIDPNGNNFTISILNAAIRTSNLILGGINALPWIVSIYDTANLSLNQANAVAGAVDTANVNITAAFLKANQVGGAVDTANNNIANLAGAITTANVNITEAFNQANIAYSTANAAFNKANTANGGAAVTRVVTIADGTSITIDGNTTDIAIQTNTQAVGTLTINSPTGTSTDGQKLILRLKSTNVQTFSWNVVFAGSTDMPLPTASSGALKYDYMGFIYNSASLKWDIIARNFGY